MNKRALPQRTSPSRRSYYVAGTNLTLTDKSTIIRLDLLALILTTPAHAERWYNGTLTSNNVCELKTCRQ